MSQVTIRAENQLNPVADDVLALTAVVRPILLGILYAIKRDIAAEAGGYENISLEMMSRLYNSGDGDCGICFEYAVHEAIKNRDARVLDRVTDALKMCRVPGEQTESILFGAEKSGALNLIDTAQDMLTDESRLLPGIQGQPPYLKQRLRQIAAAFSNPRTRNGLPYSIRGLWKADLFIGRTDSERWVGTTIKNKVENLEGSSGLRIGIVPVHQNKTDRVRKDDNKNLVICPLLHDGDFMQTFYEGWRIVQALMTSRMKMPSEAMLPRPPEREVSRMLIERSRFPVVEVEQAIKPFGQPELIETREKRVANESIGSKEADPSADLILAPKARQTDP